MLDDVPIFDLRTPYPKATIEGLRRAIVAALDNLGEQIERVDDAYLLLLSTTDFAQGTLNTVLAGQAAIAKLQAAATDVAAQLAGTAGALVARLDNLAARVAALEAACTPTPTEETP